MTLPLRSSRLAALLLVAGLGEIAEVAARPGESEPWQARAIRIAASAGTLVISACQAGV